MNTYICPSAHRGKNVNLYASFKETQYNILCEVEKNKYFASVKFDARTKRG